MEVGVEVNVIYVCLCVYRPGKLISKRPDNVNIIELDWELANNSKAVLFKKAEAEVVETPMGPGILKQRRPDGVDVIELSWELANNSKANLLAFLAAPGGGRL